MVFQAPEVFHLCRGWSGTPRGVSERHQHLARRNTTPALFCPDGPGWYGLQGSAVHCGAGVGALNGAGGE